MTTEPRYQVINRQSLEVGCGSNFRELRTYILDVVTGKVVRDIGHAKYSQAKAEQIAANMNARVA